MIFQDNAFHHAVVEYNIQNQTLEYSVQIKIFKMRKLEIIFNDSVLSD